MKGENGVKGGNNTSGSCFVLCEGENSLIESVLVFQLTLYFTLFSFLPVPIILDHLSTLSCMFFVFLRDRAPVSHKRQFEPDYRLHSNININIQIYRSESIVKSTQTSPRPSNELQTKGTTILLSTFPQLFSSLVIFPNEPLNQRGVEHNILHSHRQV